MFSPVLWPIIRWSVVVATTATLSSNHPRDEWLELLCESFSGSLSVPLWVSTASDYHADHWREIIHRVSRILSPLSLSFAEKIFHNRRSNLSSRDLGRENNKLPRGTKLACYSKNKSREGSCSIEKIYTKNCEKRDLKKELDKRLFQELTKNGNVGERGKRKFKQWENNGARTMRRKNEQRRRKRENKTTRSQKEFLEREKRTLDLLEFRKSSPLRNVVTFAS